MSWPKLKCLTRTEHPWPIQFERIVSQLVYAVSLAISYKAGLHRNRRRAFSTQVPNPASSVISTSLPFYLILLHSILLINHLTGSECTSPKPPLLPSAFWLPLRLWLATALSLVLPVMLVARVLPSVSTQPLLVTALAATPSSKTPLASAAMPLLPAVRLLVEVTTTSRLEPLQSCR